MELTEGFVAAADLPRFTVKRHLQNVLRELLGIDGVDVDAGLLDA